MARSLCTLLIGILTVGFLTRCVLRMNGLETIDFVFMSVLPIFAYRAGTHWHNGPFFLIYGAVGMLPFVLAYLDDRRLGFKFSYGESTPAGVTIAWIVGVLFVALLCNFIGKVAREQQAALDRQQAAELQGGE